MAVPKHLKGKLTILALKDAADDLEGLDEPGDSSEEDAAEGEMCCPKCGHCGPSSEFKE